MIGFANKTTKLLLVLLIILPLLFPFQFTHAATDVKNDATLSTSLVAYWELEEASGTRVDSHATSCGGSGCDLTDNNTVGQSTDCVQGNCADHEKDNTEYFSHTDHADLECGSTCSFVGWVRFESTPNQGFFSRWESGSNKSYRLWYTSSQLVWTARNDCGGSNDQQAVSWTPSTNTWYQVGVSFNGSSNETKFYVDGSQQGSTQTNGISSTCDGTMQFSIGKGDDPVDARMDDWGMWNKEISSSEVSDLYNSGSGIPYDAGGGGGGGTTTPPHKPFFLLHPLWIDGIYRNKLVLHNESITI